MSTTTPDLEALERDGYAIVSGLVPARLLEAFEADVERLVAAELPRTPAGSTNDGDPFIAVLTRSQPWRETLFPMLRNLMTVQRMGIHVADWLYGSGLLSQLGFQVPAVWPTLRADPPNESRYLLPLHQDYNSTVCRRAYRIWVPLRNADQTDGTMTIVPGTHALGPLEYDTSDPSNPTVQTAQLGGRQQLVLTASAGDGVLFDPMLVHGSIPPIGHRMKFVLLVQAQDLATLMDPDDHADEYGERLRRVRRARFAAE